MATYLMFGKYSADSVKEISADRTEKSYDLIKEHGGCVIAGYAILGRTDLVLIVDFRNTEEAMKTSIALSKMLGIAFDTAPAMTIKEFDKMTS